MRGAGDVFLIVSALILAVVMAFLIATMLSSAGAQKGGILLNRFPIELAEKGAVSPIGADGCSGTQCDYNFRISGVYFKAVKEPVDALVGISYHGRNLIFPCPDSKAALANGACRFTNDGVNINIDKTFPKASIWYAPPPLNASSRSSYTADDGAIIDGQTIKIGNFSVSFVLTKVLLSSYARYDIKCADDSRFVVHKKGDESSYTMCGGYIKIKTADIPTFGNNRVCAEITTSGGKEWAFNDKITVGLWNVSILDCLGASNFFPSGDVPFSENLAHDCYSHLISSWDMDVPVSPWEGTSYTQPAC